mgnify:FL=1
MILFIIVIAWIIGIILGLYLQISIASFVLFISLILLIFIIFEKKILKFIKSKKIKAYYSVLNVHIKILIFLVILIVAFAQIKYYEGIFENKYKNINEDDEISIIGTIVSDSQEKEYKTKYILKIDTINSNKKYKNTKVILYTKKGKETLKYGDKIELVGNFKLAKERRNPGGFDYRFYLKTKKIYGIVTTKNTKRLKENNVNIISMIANKTANVIKNQSKKLLENKKACLLIGLLIGDTDEIDEETKEDFRNSNLTHMLAVSGLHVSYVLLAVNYIITKVKIHKKLSKIIVMLLILFFILVTGATPSVLRAGTMTIYLILGGIFYRRISVFSSLNLSLLVIIIMNPYCLFDVGLQLSYAGTIGIVYLYPIIKEKIYNKANSILITISANIVIIPIMMYNFNIISLTFFISNLLAGPIIGIIIILGFSIIIISLIFFPIANIFSKILNLLIILFLNTAKACANLPFSKIFIITPTLKFIFLYYCLLVFIIIKEKIQIRISIKLKNKVIAILIILVIINPIKYFSNIKQSNLKIYFVDVGQGDSTCIVTPKNKIILIDGGGNSKDENYDIGKQTLLPYLLDKKINKIDYCIVSHFDSDHCGGLMYILKNLKVKNIIIGKQYEEYENYKEFIKIAKDKKINIRVVGAGEKITIEKNLYIDVLWPINREKMVIQNAINNNSLVFKLRYINFSMLFTGDIEEIAEKEILDKYKENTEFLKSTILKVAHHGSKTSSTKEFINIVKPKYAVIGVGKDNKFGHPSNVTIENLKTINTEIYRTDEMGEISINVNIRGNINIEEFIKK